MLYRDIHACGIKNKIIQRLLKVKSNAWKKVAEEMDSNAKYTVTFLTTSAAYRPALWSEIKFDYIFDDKLN